MATWVDFKLVLAIALVLFWLIATIRAVHDRRLLAWSVLPVSLLGVFLSVAVMKEPYDFARALAPLFTAYPLLLLIQPKEPSVGQGTTKAILRTSH
jgi:hypothetical protein